MWNMDRIQSFEFHDLPDCPEFIRESVTESLGNALRWGDIYSGGAADIFYDFCQKTNCNSLLDLCSGSGEPISILLDGMSETGLSAPDVTLSDLYPNSARMENVAGKHAGNIIIQHSPVDATNVPKDIKHSARSIISAFHHFPPDLAQGILKDCVEQEKAVFILEPMTGSINHTFSIASSLVAATALNPILTDQNRLMKALCTYTNPIIPMVNVWDALISLLRIHKEDSLREMVRPFGRDYCWEFHEIPVKWGGRVTVFTGWPKK